MTAGRGVYGVVRAIAVLWTPALAQVTDGDTLKQGGVYRLWGIDSQELAQTCPNGLAGR